MFKQLSKRFILICSLFILISVSFALLNYKNSALAYNGLYFHRNQQSYSLNNANSTSSAYNVDLWLSFLGILSTIFAVFFVYTGFKIDSTREKVDEAEKRIVDLEKKIQEEIYEYARQLEYCMSFIVSKQYDKAIDALTVLRSESVVLKDNRKINTCCFWLAHCYYERGLTQKNDDDKEADLALAVDYVNQAFDDPSQPFKKEIIDAFNKLGKQ